MKKVNRVLAFLGPVFMFLASIAMILFFGFNVTSDMEAPPVPLYIEPAGYTFIIWQLIYIGFIALSIFQLKAAYKDDSRFIKARVYIIVNSMANSAWFLGVIFNQLWITVLFMLLMLFTLIRLSIIFQLGKPNKSKSERWFVKLPLSLYFGWITVATPVNITSFLLTEVGWSGQELLNPNIWSLIILLVATAIFSWVYLKRKGNGAYLLVGVWGFTGIYMANFDQNDLIRFVSLALSAFLLLLLIITKYRTKSSFTLL